MDSFHEFCENLQQMRLRFQKWDNCERTVAIYYLMVGLPFANARFLQHALQQCIAEVNSQETQSLERNANDPLFIRSLINERPQVALSILLSHLPLLQPGNRDTADAYILTIRKVISEFIAPPFKIYNDCVEIMSYVFIHPAFEKDQKKAFKQILKQILHRVSPDNHVHSPVNESSDESVSPNPELTAATMIINNNRLNRRSNSLTPGQTSSHESLVPGQDWSSQENLTLQSTKPRSYSLSNDHNLPLNLSCLQSSSSETRLQDLQTTMNNLPIMKNIVSWLKSLRLHKYSWVFNNLTYEQMLDLTDESLQSIGITKGARHKLLISIAKLKERSMMLTELETEVMNGGDLLNALKKLKSVLQSPLQVTAGEDLPSQFVKVMGKVCTQLLMLRQPSDESLTLFYTLCERAELSDAFTGEQKRRLTLWKGQLGHGNHPPSYNNRHHSNNYRFPCSQYHHLTGPSIEQIFCQKSSSYPNVQNNQPIGAHRHSIGTITLNTMLKINAGPHVQEKPVEIHNHNNNNASHTNNNNQQHHVRFQELDPEENKSNSSSNKQRMKNIDIESSLESLCLQMMEHALGP